MSSVETTGGAGDAAPPAAPPSIKIHLKAVGSAPALKKNKFRCPGDERFSTIIAFLRRQLALGPADGLLCYLHSAFAPTPSLRVDDLYRSFAADGELVVHYSLSAAFG